jgi:hypothetical protein
MIYMARKNYEGVEMNSDAEKKSYIAEREARSQMDSYIGDNVAFDSFGRIGDTGDYKLVFDTNEKHVVCFFNPVTKKMKTKEYKA